MNRPYLLIAMILFYAMAGIAQQNEQRHDSTQAEIPKPVQVVTHHIITINGEQIHYTATTGTLLLKNEQDTAVALFGFIAYMKDGVLLKKTAR